MRASTPTWEVMMLEKSIPTKRSRRLMSAVVLASGFAVAFVAGTVLMAPTGAVADEMESSYARGGKLYDKWYKVTGAETPTAGMDPNRGHDNAKLPAVRRPG